jgi:transcriptional regulator with XRE-family HTH domain
MTEERKRKRLSGPKLALRAREQLAEITGLEAESVSSLEQDDDGTWKVVVEVLELSRVPSTDDVIGSYEAELDEDGELLGYRRIRRYPRSKAEERLSAG